MAIIRETQNTCHTKVQIVQALTGKPLLCSVMTRFSQSSKHASPTMTTICPYQYKAHLTPRPLHNICDRSAWLCGLYTVQEICSVTPCAQISPETRIGKNLKTLTPHVYLNSDGGFSLSSLPY